MMTDPPELTVISEFASEYFANRLHTDVWDTAVESDRVKSLAWASVVIRSAFFWNAGAWTESEWAEPVRFAVCEEALWLLKLDPTEYPAILTKGLVSGSAGSVSGTFSREMTAPLVCPAAESLIGELGTLNDGSAGTLKCTMLGE